MKKGFTLVELAIVMTIIGLLIGGILKGEQMITSARITATINQINAFKTAHRAFVDQFGSLPGDMPNAYARLPNCAMASGCYQGNGNGQIGTDDPGNLAGWFGEIQALLSDERTQYWRHLALADLISGISVTQTSIYPIWGETHPAGYLNGGYEVSRGYGHLQSGNGSYSYRLHNNPRVLDVDNISPRNAFRLDNKMDDGKPLTGIVISMNATVAEGCMGTSLRDYLNTDIKDCLMFFLFNL